MDSYVNYMPGENLNIIQKQFVETSYGKICVRSVGKNTDPLFLIIHGSGPKNSGKSYYFFLHEYAIRFLSTWPVFMVAFDCPGYGESTGLKSAIRGFSEKFLREFIFLLTGKKSAFILMGHSQGGNSLFNAVFANQNITNFVVAERPVIAEPKKFKECKIPILFVYDEEDDGHPIKQGKEMTKYVKIYKFLSYKASREPYWISDKLIEEIIKFLNEHQKYFNRKEDMPNFELISEINGIKLKYESLLEDNSNELQLNIDSSIKDKNTKNTVQINFKNNQSSNIKNSDLLNKEDREDITCANLALKNIKNNPPKIEKIINNQEKFMNIKEEKKETTEKVINF